jgi:electron transport complex protein RnfC
MLKKSFFGLVKPRIEYDLLPARMAEPETVVASKTVTLFHPKPEDEAPNPPMAFKVGDTVKIGQKISLYTDDPACVISSVTGTIATISPFTGDFGQNYTAITIKVADEGMSDEQFEKLAHQPDAAIAPYLAGLPGNAPMDALMNADQRIKTIVIRGADRDLLIATNQYIVKNELGNIQSGIKVLRELTGIEQIIMVTAAEALQGFGHIGAQVKYIGRDYPEALDPMIMKNVLGQVVPAGKTCEELGVCFINAEAVASIGKACDSGRMPSTKLLTVINKDGGQRLVRATIGTPIGDILQQFSISVEEKDRVVLGGPMRGAAVFSLDHPVLPNTDAIMVVDDSRAAAASQYPCVNCGECIRACPAQIPVNMLVRFLEAGQYEESADLYDLLCCIECGLCSFVCISKIPIFQYIKLAKYELKRAETAEEANV